MCQNYFFKNKPSIEPQEIVAPSAKMIEQPAAMSPAEILAEAKSVAESLKPRVLQ